MNQGNTSLPNHIAIVPDGNRRWARLHGLTRLQGHQAGADRMHNVVEWLIPLGINYLTVWGFSSDNWKRSEDEVRSIFNLLELWIRKDTPWLHRNNVRLNHIGRLHELPQDLFRTIAAAMYLTRNNTGMTLNLAFNYSGRADIIDAVRRIIDKGVASRDIDEELLTQYLYTDGMPDVDLVIRTAGEFRLSNFLIWQTAYSEFYFTEALWPDFTTEELDRALLAYGQRQRRFGAD